MQGTTTIRELIVPQLPCDHAAEQASLEGRYVPDFEVSHHDKHVVVGSVEFRELINNTEGKEVKGKVFAKVAGIILREHGVQRSFESVNYLGVSLIRTADLVASTAGCTAGSKLVAIYLLLHILKVHKSSQTLSALFDSIVKQYFVCLMIAVSFTECAFSIKDGWLDCAKHATHCSSRRFWLAWSQKLFSSLEELSEFEDRALAVASRLMPMTAEDLEYFVEFFLTPKSEQANQTVPGSSLHHFQNCFYTP